MKGIAANDSTLLITVGRWYSLENHAGFDFTSTGGDRFDARIVWPGVGRFDQTDGQIFCHIAKTGAGSYAGQEVIHYNNVGATDHWQDFNITISGVNMSWNSQPPFGPARDKWNAPSMASANAPATPPSKKSSWL